MRRDHDVARRVPGELTAEMSRAGSDGYAAWLQAREANDYAVFEPALRRNIELARRYADCFPEAEHPYDPLLDRYEPGTTAAQVTALFVRLREGLVPLLSQIAMQPARQALAGDFPVAAQREIGLEIVAVDGLRPERLAPGRRRASVRRLAGAAATCASRRASTTTA